MDEVREFCRHYNLHYDLRQEVGAFYAHFNETKTFFDEEEVKDSKLHFLRMIPLEVGESIVTGVAACYVCWPDSARFPTLYPQKGH